MLEPVFTAEDTGCEYRFLKTAPAEQGPVFSGRGFPRGFPGGTFFEHQGAQKVSTSCFGLSAGDRAVTRSTGPLCPWYALWSSRRTTPVTSAQERLS